jgi:hypothetical protein
MKSTSSSDAESRMFMRRIGKMMLPPSLALSYSATNSPRESGASELAGRQEILPAHVGGMKPSSSRAHRLVKHGRIKPVIDGDPCFDARGGSCLCATGQRANSTGDPTTHRVGSLAQHHAFASKWPTCWPEPRVSCFGKAHDGSRRNLTRIESVVET